MSPAGNHIERSITGRFAPSPTGSLHFGSLISALASYLNARSRGGNWLIRIEDIDPPREVDGSAASILQDLNHLGLESDGTVLYQSSRLKHYQSVAADLVARGKAFWCGCSRKELPRGGVYPGTCRNGLPPGKEQRAIRLNVSGQVIRFTDAIQGKVEEDLQSSVGDFVIQRADGLPAYQLAVVLDDAFQGVTEVVRGMDLFSSTGRQIGLQQALQLTTPKYAHHALALNAEGNKLGKRFGSVPVAQLDTQRAVAEALRFLGQRPPPDMNLRDLIDWGIEHWQLSQIPAVPSAAAPELFLPT